MNNLTQENFLKEVDKHIIEIIRDDGVYRHIRFREPGTMMQHFDLITWPGYLCYCGDMGNYVFSRTRDMFQFFRTDREYAKSKGRRLDINLSYWSEKLQAVDGNRRGGNAKEYSEERFVRIIKEKLVAWWRDRGLNREQRKELREEIYEQILSRLDDECHTEQTAHILARDFEAKIDGQRFEFTDFWEYDLTDYTHRFVWCAYALAWGIELYDTTKATMEAVPA